MLHDRTAVAATDVAAEAAEATEDANAMTPPAAVEAAGASEAEATPDTAAGVEESKAADSDAAGGTEAGAPSAGVEWANGGEGGEGTPTKEAEAEEEVAEPASVDSSTAPASQCDLGLAFGFNRNATIGATSATSPIDGTTTGSVGTGGAFDTETGNGAEGRRVPGSPMAGSMAGSVAAGAESMAAETMMAPAGRVVGASVAQIGTNAFVIGGMKSGCRMATPDPFLTCTGFDMSDPQGATVINLDVGNGEMLNRAGHASWVLNGKAYLFGGELDADPSFGGGGVSGETISGTVGGNGSCMVFQVLSDQAYANDVVDENNSKSGGSIAEGGTSSPTEDDAMPPGSIGGGMSVGAGSVGGGMSVVSGAGDRTLGRRAWCASAATWIGSDVGNNTREVGIVHGGRDEAGNILGDTWLYDPRANLWHPLEPTGTSPGSRMYHSGRSVAATLFSFCCSALVVLLKTLTLYITVKT